MGAVLVHPLLKFVCASYQGSSPSLNKPFVYLGCSLLWAGCPPGCCLSALFESLIKAHLSLSTLSLHPLFHSFNHFPDICSCSLQMFLLYFSFYALAKLSSLCHLVISSFTLFSIPHPWHCLPVPFCFSSASFLLIFLFPPGVMNTPQCLLLPSTPSALSLLWWRHQVFLMITLRKKLGQKTD